LLAAAGVLELQKRTLARATNLLKAGRSAQKDVDQSTSDQQTAEGNYKAARDAVRIFGKTDAEVDQVVDMRKVDSTLRVPSPIAGRVVARNAAPGLLTQPGNTPSPYSVADLSTMWMLAHVIETDAPAYRVGQDVEVRVPAYPDKVFKGHVTALGSTIDPNSRRQMVRSQIDDPEHLLRSGMFASPAPVILEITAQAAGLSAEEMEKYYTIPMEVGLYPTPGVINIRSISFYGLSFVRVTFKYGVDFYFAISQASISLQQNVNLPPPSWRPPSFQPTP
jgi:hypothetical protein